MALTHFDAQGAAHMADVGAKDETRRGALAAGRVVMGGEALALAGAGSCKKADVLGALKLADELKVKPIVSGGSESWKVAGELARRNVSVILGPIMTVPRETGDRYDASYAAAGKLHAAGVPMAIGTDINGLDQGQIGLFYQDELQIWLGWGYSAHEGLQAAT